MKRRNNHAYHDFTQNEQSSEPYLNNPYPNPTYPVDQEPIELPEQTVINQRLASFQIQSSRQKLVDQIPGPEIPSTLGITGSSREPIPEIPEERELAQAAVSDGNEGLFRTFQDTSPPPADCKYTVIDQGVSGPNFIRSSMYNVPNTEKLRKMSQLPLALQLCPFAEPEVPLADFSQFDGEELPPRCHRCRAYMNPSMRFVDGGAKFVCNLCLFVNNTPPDYFQPIGPDGRRIDWEERPELAFGTYDFIVVPSLPGPKGTSISKNGRTLSTPGQGSGQGATPLPQMETEIDSDNLIDPESDTEVNHLHLGNSQYPPLAESHLSAPVKSLYGDPVPKEFRRVFCCECGRDASQKNTIALFAESITASLPYLGDHDKVAIMTFDANITYFRLTSSGEIQMLVTSPENSIVPPDVFIDPRTQGESLLKLLERLPYYFQGSMGKSSCLGSALESVLGLPSSSQGGRVTVMFNSLPSRGPSQLRMRDNAIAGITPPDAPVHKELFEQSSSFYKDLIKKFTQNGWGCDLFAIPSTGYLDMPNLAPLSYATGGKLFYYPRFVEDRDSRRVIADMLSVVSAPMQARNTSLRVRSSTGLQIDRTYGGGDGKTGFMTSDTTFLATVTYDGNLDPKLDAHFQAAVLYTSPSGEKRVRICNLLTGVTTKLKPVLKFVDSDVVLATIVRQTLSQMSKHTTQELRQAVLAKVENIFGAARLHAGQGMPLTQLLMPTNLRQLLMFGLSLTKTVALGSRSYSSDARVVNAAYLSEAKVNQLALALYPRIYDIGVLRETKLSMSRARFSDIMLGSHAFIVFDGQQIYIWLSELVSPQVLLDLFGVKNLDEVGAWLDEIPVLDTELNKQARELCAELAPRVDRSWIPLQIVRQRLDGAEYQLRQLMVEDTINDSPSYINFVVRVHHKAKEYNEKEGWF